MKYVIALSIASLTQFLVLFNVCIIDCIWFYSDLQFLPGLLKPLLVRRVDDVDQDVGVLKVVAPIGTDLALAPDVPHCEGRRNGDRDYFFQIYSTMS